MKKQISLLFSLSFLFISLFFYSNANAAPVVHCNGFKLAQYNLQGDYGQNSLAKTDGFLINNFGPTFSSSILGSVKPETLEKCVQLSTAKLAQDKGKGTINLDADCTPTEEEAKRCAAMELISYNNSTMRGMGGGGLLGFSAKLEGATKEPLPFYLAYYFNKNVQKIPVVRNTAFAATGSEYGGPFLDAIYTYWEIFRNGAYLFMSVVMLIVGILIMGRNKVDAKAAITVQQVLPQIVIALILITFSYPIGAAGASLAYNIRGNIETTKFFESMNVGQYFGGPTVVGIVTSLGLGTIFGIFTGVGSFLAIIVAITGLVVLIFYMLVLLKVFGIYLKMLMAIVTAPLTFALGALPGNQKITTNWFMAFGANMLSIPAIAIGLSMVNWMVADIGLGGFVDTNTMGAWGTNVFTSLITPVIAIYGYKIVLDIPGKIEEALGVGGKKK